LRIVSESLLDLSLGDLGMSDPDRERLERALVQPTGIIIFGGPTGSGKTTVLYSAVMHAQSDENAVITVESTVYHLLPGAVQVQTNPRAGLSVANALQSVMRADPDIIAIGDVPDRESANLAVEAGLTGHLVLVQLHANDALGNIQRVLDAGIEPFLFGHSLIASVNQRLVRKVCEHCREKLPVDDETVSAWRRRAEAGGLEWQADATFVQGAGCERCRGVGFWRQTALFEVLAVEPEVASLIAQGADLEAVHAAGVAGGMTTLFADGIRKALEGITSPIEVARVCDPAWMSV
jgi:type II secretory ATPase GspE/PulE/Tfp pilus assembly ATPase PilB-like protein